MLSIGYGYSLFHSIGIPTFAQLIAPNKIIKKMSVYFCVICVHYIIVLICAYMLFTLHRYFNHPIFICQQGELSICLFFFYFFVSITCKYLFIRIAL